MLELGFNKLVERLNRAGRRPPEELVERILAGETAALEPLLALATNRKLLQRGGEALLGPIHALRLLGELRSPSLVRPLLELFPLDEDVYSFGDPLLTLWEREVPQIIARVGASASEDLWAVARDGELSDWRRHVAISALAHMATIDAALRAATIAGLRELVAGESDSMVVASAIAGLGLLNARECYSDVMQAYKSGRVDTGIVSAGLARQMLLARRAESSTSCAAHPLWERYDEHGPSEEDLAGSSG